MKKLFLLIAVAAIGISHNFAQESHEQGRTNVYSVFVNIVNEPFRFPLIGFVNIARGSHTLPQIGFINFNQNNFSTLQAGFINTVGGDMAGFQLGFVNTTAGSFQGAQLGFVNTTAGSFQGAQIGFVNTAARGDNSGLQLGFVNTAFTEFAGAQISFINIARKIDGFQIGFINYADTIENGIPIGLISIVRNGGFRAVELSINEIAHANFAFKIGLEILYTSLNVSWNPTIDWGYSLLTGVGFGTHVSINNNFFFNPELTFISNMGIGDTNINYYSFAPNFGFRIAHGFSVLIAPAITWVHFINNGGEISETFLALYNHEINRNHNLLAGARVALRFQW